MRAVADLNELKSEHTKILAEVSGLRLRDFNVPAAEIEQWRSFKKSLVNKLENVDVQAPVMSEEQLLGVIDSVLDNQKKIKELQIENQNLSRLAVNAEENVKYRIMELTRDNDQLKRKLRESTCEVSFIEYLRPEVFGFVMKV